MHAVQILSAINIGSILNVAGIMKSSMCCRKGDTFIQPKFIKVRPTKSNNGVNAAV
jgi:hypothetical protein